MFLLWVPTKKLHASGYCTYACGSVLNSTVHAHDTGRLSCHTTVHGRAIRLQADGSRESTGELKRRHWKQRLLMMCVARNYVHCGHSTRILCTCTLHDTSLYMHATDDGHMVGFITVQYCMIHAHWLGWLLLFLLLQKVHTSGSRCSQGHRLCARCC